MLLSAPSLLAQQVSGHVLAPDGEPLAEARVELEVLLPADQLAERQLSGELTPDLVARARTDRDGGFSLEAPQPGFWRVVVRHPEYLPANFDLSPLLADRRLPGLTLQRRSELVAWWLTDDDQPLADVHFAARGWSAAWRASSRDGWWPADRWARSRQDGRSIIACESDEKVSIAAADGDRFLFRIVDCTAGVVELRLVDALRPVRVVHAADDAALDRPASQVFGFVRWPFLAFGLSDEDGMLRAPFDWQEKVPLVFADVSAFYGEPRLREDAQAAESSQPPVFELPATYEVVGRVVDRLDERAISQAFLWAGRGAHFFRTLGRDGSYVLRLPVGDDVAVGFGAPGYVPLRHRFSEATEQLARLMPALAVSGRVVDVQGNGIAGARVRSAKPRLLLVGQRNPEGELIRSTIEEISGEDGTFQLQGLAPERPISLQVSRSGFADHRERLPSQPAGSDLDDVMITLERGYDGFGWVVTENDLPIAGAEVALLPALTGSASVQDYAVQHNFGATTDAEGYFQLQDLPAGTFYLAAKSRGFPELLVPGIEIVETGEPLDLGTVVLVPGLLLSGRVIDDAGEPVAGAQLSVRNADGEQIVVQRAESPWFATVTSRQNGSFHLDGLPRERRLTVLVSADGFLPRTVPVTTENTDQQLTVELTVGAGVRGVVLEPGGEPAAGARVVARAPGPDRRLDATAKSADSDAEGRFRIEGLRPSEYELTATTDRARSTPSRHQLDGGGTLDVLIQLEPRATVEVTVTTPDGARLALARVQTLVPTPWGQRPTHDFTDQSGEAVLGPLDAGSHTVRAHHDQYESVEAQVEVAGTSAVPLTLAFERRRDTAESRVAGRVVDPAGRPIADARLSLEGGGGRAATSSSDGSFELVSQAGEVVLECRHADYPTYRERLDLTGGDALGLQIVLEPGAAVVGQVTGIEPEQLARVVVVARGPLTELDKPIAERPIFEQTYGSINFEGAYRVSGLSAGEWQIRAELLNPKRSASQRVELTGNEEVRVDLHFDTGYSLTGSVFAGGEAAGGAVVIVTCRGEFRAETFVDRQGRFAIDNVPGRSCVVQAQTADRSREARQELEVTFDTDVVLDLQ
ncbi:MAG: carboxypeptidase-like regulatory domain-containing protein [Acidobacteriota bacterium]